MKQLRKPRNGRTGPLVIAIYARISQSKLDGISVGDQVEEGRDYIEERGYVVGPIFKDESKSAWNKNVVREDWEELMKLLEAGEVDGVWVYDLTRFTRKVMEGERLVDICESGEVVALSSFGSYDLTTAQGRGDFRGAIRDAAKESDKISERTARGKRLKAKRGKSNASRRGFALPGFLPNPPGWEQGDPRLPVPPERLEAERAAVRHLADAVFQGTSTAAMVRWLNGTGLRTNYGNEWDSVSMRNMLKRPSLAGLLYHDGKEIGLTPDEPVLDRETWERMVALLDSRRPGRAPSGRYLLTNLLTCGRCGYGLTGRPIIRQTPYTTDLGDGLGTVRRQYICMPRLGRQGGCGRMTVDMRFADQVVEQVLKNVLGDPRHADRLNRRAQVVQAERDRITAEVERLNDSIDQLTDRVGEGAWTVERVDRQTASLHARIVTLEEELKATGQPEPKAQARRDAAAAWDRTKAAGDTDELRRSIRRAFPDGITLRPTELRGLAARNPDRFDFDPRGTRGRQTLVA